MNIYHKNVGFPTSLLLPKELIIKLGYTTHAQERKQREQKYNISLLPSIVKITKENIIEAYTKDNQNLNKVRIQIPYDKRRNIIIILELFLKTAFGKVITFWLNNKNHHHKNLNLQKYNKP